MINSVSRHSCLFIPIWLHQWVRETSPQPSTTRHPFHKPFSLLPTCMLILLCVCITEPTNINCVVLKFRLRFRSQEKLSVANDVLSWSFATFQTTRCAVCYLGTMQFSIPGPSVCYNTLRLYIIRDIQHDLDNT